ncbi:cyclohexanecarboxylate-CoA ligase [Polymorphum gilvum]|uniref:AMP-dependent synthetase and ligase n=1 Tax=Polymorphum gilvum (strain LMG 25793 / CGMCC 1.9160 / SL003B-26A1) TaxID=991905 RepID=F2J4H9_POLGS|nr:cyclohexanecarboxylate-CoA ligase [Polymorphum gilvum]ADZ72232.1 AMP-dependent synthetase and ligase [Polymorphum gilvum SL003B-26A1]
MKFDAILIEPRIRAMTEAGHWRDKTADDHFDACLAADPDALALSALSVATGERHDLTWTELDLLADRAAIGLRRLGVGRNDVVTCQLPNGWQFVATYLGCSRIGAVFNPVMHIFREHELLFMLRHGESKVFVVPKVFRGFDHEAMAERMRPDLPDLRRVVVASGEGPNSFETLLCNPAFDAERSTIRPDSRLGPNDVCQLIYTSGTTGEPKGVMHTANTMYSNLAAFSDRLGLTGQDTVLMFSPMAHQTGFMYGLLLPLMLRSRFIVMDVWDRLQAAKVIETDKVGFTMASTPFLIDLSGAVEDSGADTSSLRVFLCAGTAIPGPVVERAQRVLGAKVISAWGMTENGAVTVVRPSDPDSRSIDSDGLPLPGMEIQIRDRNGRPAGPGVEGELFVRGCSNFGGYLKRPHLNNVDAEGWFDTGDIARADAEGYIRICGRSKDIIIRGAENIPVIEVEAILFKHPAVQSVAIVGYPDERLGERACAFVVPKPGQTLTFEDMQAFLKSHHLAIQYWPERLEIRDALPATASGKIQKFALRKMLREEVGTS